MSKRTMVLALHKAEEDIRGAVAGGVRTLTAAEVETLKNEYLPPQSGRGALPYWRE